MAVKKEFKLKAKVNDLALYKERLSKFAKFDNNYECIDFFFRIDVGEMNMEIRLRKIEGKKLVTIKIPTSKDLLQENEEYSFKVKDKEDFVNFLQETGYKISSVLSKKWESYKYGKFRINLCEIENLGFYVEIITQFNKGKANEERLKKKLFSILKMLELKEHDIDSRYYDSINIQGK